MKLATAAVLVLFPAVVFTQQTIHVPGDAPTIQLGIALAEDGDTVLVDPGTYQERIDFLGKAITVKTLATAPSLTIITAENLLPLSTAPYHAVVRFRSNEGLASVLDGFTVTGVTASPLPPTFHEAAIYCGDLASPIIRNCVIEGNFGIGGVKGAGLIEFCTIRNNAAIQFDGGGVYSAGIVRNSIIESNYGYYGGGLAHVGVVEDTIVRFNGTGEGGRGGGIYGVGVVSRCFIYGNTTDYNQGGGGAGIHSTGFVVVDRSVVAGNEVVTFVCPDSPGISGPGVDVVHSIIWGNTAPCDPPQLSPSASVAYSDIYGGHAGSGNIDADPLFLNADHGDFRLLPDSPCINAGDPLSDLDADGTIADMGAIPFDHFPVCDGVQAKLSAEAAFDHVGHSLAASSPYVIAGVPDVDGPGFESGTVSIVYRDGEEWIELPQITASDQAADALFGHSVALHEDVALIGARGASAEAGAAYVFRQQEDGTWAEEAKLEAADAQAGDWLGSRVAIEGDVAVAAALHADAPGADSGAVYVFRDTGSGWAQEQKLVGLDTAAGDQFGKGLAMSGGRILAGAYADDDAGQDSGSAYVFRDDGGFWTQEAKLTASDAAANALFGNEVALDGEVAVVAARSANGVGAAYVFRRSGTSWTQEAKLTASTPFPNAEFGSAVAVAGNRILVGARLDDSAANEAGAAYLLEFDGAAWNETAKYTLPEAAPGDHLGSAVALSGGYAMVGAEWADDPELDSGELWAFPLPGTCQPQITSVQPTSAQFPEGVTAEGLFLGQTQSVLVDGVPASLIGVSDFTVTYQPQPGAPGHVALEASGLDGTALAEQQMFPSLDVSTTGIGGTVDVLLDNGEPGLYVLAFATGVFPTPLPITSPPTWYGVALDITGPVFTPSTGAFATTDPVLVSLPVPGNPALSGLTLHFQAWCQQGFFGAGVSYSFTNEGAVTL